MPANGFTLGAVAASESSFQVRLHARGRGRRLRDTGQACSFSSLGKVPERSHPSMKKASPRQFVLLKQEGEKVPERKDTGIALQ